MCDLVNFDERGNNRPGKVAMHNTHMTLIQISVHFPTHGNGLLSNPTSSSEQPWH